MHNEDIRIGLIKVGKQQKDLLAEINKREHMNMKKNQFSDYMTGRIAGPQGERVLSLARTIVSEWEKEAEL